MHKEISCVKKVILLLSVYTVNYYLEKQLTTILNKDTRNKEQLALIKQKAAKALLEVKTNTNSAYDVLRYAAAGFYEVKDD